MKSKSTTYTRIAKPIKGSEIAAKPRTHASESASEDVKRQNPQRQDLLRRHMISNRRDNNQN
jgi:hypothetical protein